MWYGLPDRPGGGSPPPWHWELLTHWPSRESLLCLDSRLSLKLNFPTDNSLPLNSVDIHTYLQSCLFVAAAIHVFILLHSDP